MDKEIFHTTWEKKTRWKQLLHDLFTFFIGAYARIFSPSRQPPSWWWEETLGNPTTIRRLLLTFSGKQRKKTKKRCTWPHAARIGERLLGWCARLLQPTLAPSFCVVPAHYCEEYLSAKRGGWCGSVRRSALPGRRNTRRPVLTAITFNVFQSTSLFSTIDYTRIRTSGKDLALRLTLHGSSHSQMSTPQWCLTKPPGHVSREQLKRPV